jgi:hypothetical protein
MAISVLMKLPVLLISIFLLIGLAGASTVTLTGTCSPATINQTNNYITFNITNIGNGTASNLVLRPIIAGAHLTSGNGTIVIPIVAPGTKYSEKISLSNFSLSGSYVEIFDANYSQSPSEINTLFICLANIDQSTYGPIQITNITRNSGSLNVYLKNSVNKAITAQISVYAPSAFSVSPATKNITIDAYNTTNTTFSITSPQYTDASFPIGIGASYVGGELHYEALSITSIVFGSKPSGSLGQSLILWILLAIIILIIILIIASIIVKKRGKSDAEEQGQVE